MRKRVFGHMRTAKAQISLRVRAGWSGPFLSANRTIEYYRIYEWKRPGWLYAHAQDDLHLCILRMFRRLVFALRRHILYPLGNRTARKTYLCMNRWPFRSCISKYRNQGQIQIGVMIMKVEGIIQYEPEVPYFKHCFSFKLYYTQLYLLFVRQMS